MPTLFAAASSAAALIASLATAPAQAHDGHDHGVPPLPKTMSAPRAEAASDAFELVAVARAGEITVRKHGK